MIYSLIKLSNKDINALKEHILKVQKIYTIYKIPSDDFYKDLTKKYALLADESSRREALKKNRLERKFK